uniref:VOC domain-containing protein n=1 Tax=Chromera velia CCMP2878 TaxID=1169474 RepID=A0A0G4HJZ2_9ALVE|mmetsp:Transcript_18897/g.38170  ORF Transcript_18897/g.38170 Transcript_18897/m.38170 type:complete len:185 (-) Transcript_18897:78-632(-)|eukprot:Cvel_28425.t1-p1 / transcript=Cvel_28425.t1 / gene=Cvel_28425 / organism=Chromera_velia_CCMP2878 / gene_product=hypothetical protein / transcript_product=hypothetical protein / location=Cvel_scaffold3719:1952-4036(-) / protein_length=184 / sequence_SO=supercontig / SO=protein_coding / is_pseudo=false
MTTHKVEEFENELGEQVVRFTYTGDEGPDFESEKPESKISLSRLNHISIGCADPQRLGKFYKNVLGFSELPRPDLPFGGIWLSFPDSPPPFPILHIIETDPKYKEDNEARAAIEQKYHKLPEFIRRGRHLAFESANIEEIKQQLVARRISFQINVVPGSRAQQCFFLDPEGFGIEVLERKESSV